MDLDFTRAHIDGTVRISSMIKNLSKIFEDFPEEITNTGTSPATDRLFDIMMMIKRKTLYKKN